MEKAAMRYRKYIICLAVLHTLLLVGGCKKKCSYCNPEKLMATWKLSAIKDQAGDVILAEPTNANRPMLLTFVGAEAITGNTLGNSFEGSFFVKNATNQISIQVHYTTLVYEVSDWSNLFFNGLNNAREFIVNDTHLSISCGTYQLELTKQ
jgi:hypothetical protein